MIGTNHLPIDGSNYRLINPLLVPSSFAIAYLFGAQTSHIIIALSFISFILCFYSIMTKYTSRTFAIIATFFAIITPRFYIFSALSSNSFQFAIYSSLSMLYLYRWIDKKKKNTTVLP